MWNVSVGDVVFLQPLGNRAIRSKPDYLIECEVTKTARKYVYLRPFGSDLPSDYARVDRETLMYYDLNDNGGWVLWRSRKDFEDHKAAERALGCISDLCRCIQNQFSSMDNRSATQPVIEQVKFICMEMTKLLTSIEADQETPNIANKKEIILAAQSAVQAYIVGDKKPTGLRPAYQFIRDAVMEARADRLK